MKRKKKIFLIVVAVFVVSVGYWFWQNSGEILPKAEPGTIKILSPNGREIWEKGQNVKIKWVADKDIKFVDIRLAVLSNETSQNFNAAIAYGAENTGSFNWTVQELYAEVWGFKTLPASDKYVIIIEDVNHNNIYDRSDSIFTIK